MGEPPLHQAQQVLAELRQNADKLTLVSLRSKLEQLADLLNSAGGAAAPAPTGAAAPPAESAPSMEPSLDVAALRGEMDALRDDTASFTSMMVHEIRKPMTSIRGYVDMLAKGIVGPLTETQQQFADTIRNNIMAMEGLVSDLSDYNKLHAKRFNLDAKMTTLGQVMMEAQRQADALNAGFGHTLLWEVPGGLPPITADQKQLAKVIYKLVANAIQYTPPAEASTEESSAAVDRTIMIKAEPLAGSNLRVSVIDHGIGLTDDVMQKLGEPFFRGDHELVISQKGYGMGIPVAMALLKLMGSELKFTGKPEEGSTFSFELAGIG